MQADDLKNDRTCILDFGRGANRTLVRTSYCSSTESPVNNEPKIMSIAPSFNCMLKCEGCYLTTDVTKEMRDATVDMGYWERAMTLAVKHGYEELAMTLNPFPGAIEQTIELAKMAKAIGFRSVNVTVTWDGKLDWENQIRELIPHIDVLSESIDENRNTIMDNDFILSNPHVHYNLNLLWSVKFFEKVLAGENLSLAKQSLEVRKPLVDRGITATVQHLILKPLSLYGDVEQFMSDYDKVLETIPIAGDGKYHVGDVAFGNLMGLNDCPGGRMLDIDPMGFARRCPENPSSFDASNIEDLESLLISGAPGCDGPCDCIA